MNFSIKVKSLTLQQSEISAKKSPLIILPFFCNEVTNITKLQKAYIQDIIPLVGELQKSLKHSENPVLVES